MLLNMLLSSVFVDQIFTENGLSTYVIGGQGPNFMIFCIWKGLRNTRSKEFSVANTRSRNFGSRNFGSNGILGRREFSVEEFWVEGNFGSNKNYQ